MWNQIAYNSKVKKLVSNINYYNHIELRYSNHFSFVHIEQEKSKKIYTSFIGKKPETVFYCSRVRQFSLKYFSAFPSFPRINVFCLPVPRQTKTSNLPSNQESCELVNWYIFTWDHSEIQVKIMINSYGAQPFGNFWRETAFAQNSFCYRTVKLSSVMRIIEHSRGRNSMRTASTLLFYFLLLNIVLFPSFCNIKRGRGRINVKKKIIKIFHL